jgi:hypothetical protein
MLLSISGESRREIALPKFFTTKVVFLFFGIFGFAQLLTFLYRNFGSIRVIFEVRDFIKGNLAEVLTFPLSVISLLVFVKNEVTQLVESSVGISVSSLSYICSFANFVP